MRQESARPGPDARAATAAFALAAGLVALAAAAVVRREGNLAWDDADYLRQGLEVAHRLEDRGPAAALGAWLRVRPKPPMLVGWIAAWAAAVGRERTGALLLASSVVPFALLLAATAGVAWRRFGPRAAPWAVALVGASPLALSLGAKVMVETFMGLWVLLAFHAGGLLLERPTAGRAAGFGAAIGAALLTKLTAALLLPVPLAAFAIAFARRHGFGGGAIRPALVALGATLALAGPWYARNGRAAAEFAGFSSRYNVEAVGRPEEVPRGARLAWIAADVSGWWALGALGAAGLAAAARPARDAVGATRASAADRAFAGLAGLSLASGAAILMRPPYFDPRFLLPAWPAAAVAAAGALAWAGRRAGAVGVAPAAVLLALGLAGSARSLADEPGTRTYWGTRAVLDELAGRYGARLIGNVGNAPDWNVSKTGLMNAMRADPDACFVLHDLSRLGPAERERRLARLDAVLVLDQAALPPGFLEAAPGLNRAYRDAAGAVAGSPRFRRLEGAAGGLPVGVYVRVD